MTHQLLVLVAHAFFIFKNLNLTKPSISIVKTSALFFRKATIHAYAVTLIMVRKKAFGEEHITTKASVIKKLEKLVNSYYNQIYSVFHRSKPRSSSKRIIQKSLRQLNKEWRPSVDSKTGKILDTLCSVINVLDFSFR